MIRLLFGLAAVVWFFASSPLAAAQTLRAESGGVVIGRDAKDTTINIGIPPEQFAALLKLSAELSETQKKLIAELEQKFALNQQQVRGALAILGEANIPPEQLGSKLVEVAERFKDLRATALPQRGDDPKIAALKIDARKAIDAGKLEEADGLLAIIEAEQRRSLNRLAMNAAATLAQRGEIALTRLRYAEAAKHFADAADLVPASELLIRAQYFHASGMAAYDAGMYPRAENALTEALRIREKLLTPNHADLARSLRGLAELYLKQERYAEADPLSKRALAISEKAFGPEHPEFANYLDTFAALYQSRRRYSEAEHLYKRALAISEKALGREHRDVAVALHNLAALYYETTRYADAEPLYQRALAINENALGAEHLAVATNLNNLASLYSAQLRYGEAEPLFKRALATRERALVPEHPDIATILNDLALIYPSQNRYAEAEHLLKRALAIRERVFGIDHPRTRAVRRNLQMVSGVLLLRADGSID